MALPRNATIDLVEPSMSLLAPAGRPARWWQRQVSAAVPRSPLRLELAGSCRPTRWSGPRVPSAPRGGGNPRMIMATAENPGFDVQAVFSLRNDVTTIGNAADNDIRLPGLDPYHAELRRDERDQYVVHRLGRLGDTRVDGGPVDRAQMRCATRLQVGGWTMSFQREDTTSAR